MSGRRGGNRIRGPQSALTDFLQANNISAAQIRDDYERRRRETEQANNAGEGTSNQTDDAEDAAVAAAVAAEAAEEEEKAEKTKKRKRNEEKAIEKIKKAKASASAFKKSKGKKARPAPGQFQHCEVCNKRFTVTPYSKEGSDGGLLCNSCGKDLAKDLKAEKKRDDDSDEDDDFDEGLGNEMYKKARPAPGQFEHCEVCNKRFTVTPYSKEGPDGGLLCTTCGKDLARDLKAEKKASAPKPVGRKRRKLESDRLDGVAVGGAKTLQHLCIAKIAEYHEDVEELGDMPQPILERVGEIFSKKRVMKPTTLPLFLRPDLDSVIVHDAAYLEEEDYERVFATVPRIQRLVLSNACQFKDRAMDYMLDKCENLTHLHLYAANLVSDEMWHRTFREAGAKLEVVKLKWLDAAFDDLVVKDMVVNAPHLRRLKLKLCRRIGEDAVRAISTLQQLEHLSLMLNKEVPPEALVDLVRSRGSGLRTLSLEKFLDADDSVLEAMHDFCKRLTKLRISENDTASDAGYAKLFTGWTNVPLTFADFNSTRDVDNNSPDGPEEAVGLASAGFKALMVHSGPALKHIDIASCRHIELSAFMDVFNGAEEYPALEEINVSFCNRVDNSVIAGIFKSCPNLKKLVAFGCFDIQDVVVPRNIALIGVPKAQDAIEQFGTGVSVDEALSRMVEVAA